MKENKPTSFEIDNRLQLLAIFLLLVVAVPGIRNGWKLLNDPTGESAGYSLEQISGSPFESYLFPGVAIFFFFGILNLLAAIFVFLEIKNYPWMVMGQGLLLVLWLGGEVFLGISTANLLYPFFVIGFFLILLGALMRFKQHRLKKRQTH